MKTAVSWTALTVAILAIPGSAAANSAFSCTDRGVELRPNFIVQVTYRDKTLPGASIEVTELADSSRKSRSQMTGPDGRAAFGNLSPGDYWIKAKYLGIDARYECFHINPSPSRKAKKIRRYEWGDMPVGVREPVGRLVDLQSKGDGTTIDKLIRRVQLPIQGAKLELRRPLSDVTYKAVSDAAGDFRFENAPPGVYVLHIDPHSASDDFLFDSADFLIAVGKTARIGSLRIMRGASLGSSRALSLDLVPGKV